jgi:hypothetical protein
VLPPPSWATVRGRIFGHDGPLAGVPVTLALAPDQASASACGATELAQAPRRAITDATGSFGFDRAVACASRIFVGPDEQPWPVRARWAGGAVAFGIHHSWPVALGAGQSQDLVLEVRPQGAAP